MQLNRQNCHKSQFLYFSASRGAWPYSWTFGPRLSPSTLFRDFPSWLAPSSSSSSGLYLPSGERTLWTCGRLPSTALPSSVLFHHGLHGFLAASSCSCCSFPNRVWYLSSSRSFLEVPSWNWYKTRIKKNKVCPLNGQNKAATSRVLLPCFNT